MKINQSFQEFIFDYKTYLTVLYGGAGSSKSHSWTQKIIIKCLQSPRKVLVMRATQASLRDSCIALFKSILEDEGISYEYKVQHGEIRIGPSVILFKGGDNEERLKSLANLTDIVIEEATELIPSMFTQLVLRLRSQVPDLQITLAFNPVSRENWVHRYFFDTSSPDYFLDGIDHKIFHSTYKDNAFLPQQYIDNLLTLRKSNPYYYKVYVEGEFGTLGRLIFPHGSYQIKHLQIPSNAKYLAGMDPGVVDKFAISRSAYWTDEEGNHILYTYLEFCQSMVLNKTVAQWLKTYIPSSQIVYADNAGLSQIRELNSLGCYNVKKNSKPPGSIITSIDTIKAFDYWYIDPSCENLLKDLSIYQWHKDKQTGLYTLEPERVVDGYHCDLIDSVRYSMEGLGSSVKLLHVPLPKGL